MFTQYYDQELIKNKKEIEELQVKMERVREHNRQLRAAQITYNASVLKQSNMQGVKPFTPPATVVKLEYEDKPYAAPKAAKNA